MAVVELGAERDELARHEVEGQLRIPGLEWIARAGGEVRSPAERGGAVDWREQHQVAPRVVDRAAADGERDQVVVEPQTGVRHEARKKLRRSSRLASSATDAAAILATGVEGKRKRGH